MNEDRGQRIYKIVMLIMITALITGIVTTVLVYQKLIGTMDVRNIASSGNYSGLELTLSKIRAELEDKYIGEINDEDMLETAIKGYVAGIGDEYTKYYTPEEMEKEYDEAMGNYVGIGIYMVVNHADGTIVVSEPMKDSPAEKAGIKAKDIITKVDDQEITKDNVSSISNEIKGEEGTKVKLEIKRENETLIFEVERKRIVVNHITSEIKEGNIGYIVITDFDGGAAEQFKNEYTKLKKQGIKSLIIDIRNNGGGVVDESLEILDMLCKKDETLLITVDKRGTETIAKSKNKPIVDVPIVLLTNQYSASASEIFAGALKDNERAKLVGTKTYGKGVIQILMKLTNGSGLKMTAEEYYTPKHNKINKVGIEPDYVVELPKGITKLTDENDAQLKKAIDLLKEQSDE